MKRLKQGGAISEKSGNEELEYTQDSEGQLRWDMTTAHDSRDPDSLARFWPRLYSLHRAGGQLRVDQPRSMCGGR